ncbi:hypothetical protein [Embleya sp. AB8]|uniref:hypothetical protein n=1 Tax=Embleya sp. AB8 TaxID=3156304 RepID=UPI003C761C01
MDASTALDRATICANLAFTADADARARLTEALAAPQNTNLASYMRDVITTAANAQPWHSLLERAEHCGLREALIIERRKATESLLVSGYGMSTCMITNAGRFAEQEGLRRFLSGTELIDITETPAPVAEPAPEPAPGPASIPVPPQKVTQAQRRVLQVIAEAGVAIYEGKIGQRRVETRKSGHVRPRMDMVQQAIERGWAVQDRSISLYRGQDVSLTDAGRAILAG